MTYSFFKKLALPVDGASLAFLRIVYGLIMSIDIVRLYFKGNLTTYYFTSTMEFNYYFAPWIKEFPDHIMVGLYWLGFIFSICFMLGYRFKITGLLFILIQTYFFLCSPLNYLNHMYLAIILGFLLWITASHKIWSLDSIKNRKKGKWTANDSVPKWSVYLIRLQMEIMLIFAGLVKLTPEFYEGNAIREWFNYNYNYMLFSYEWEIRVAVLIAITTHLLIAPFLLIKSTRLYALLIYGFFHFSNATLFSGIGIFPYLTFAATTIFLDPSWPRKIFAFFKNKLKKQNLLDSWPMRIDADNKKYLQKNIAKPLFFCLALWTILQILLPLRHYIIPGNVHWDRNGNLFSWQMMLISRRYAEGGGFYICGEKSDGETECRKDSLEDSYLPLQSYVQIYMYPDLALQYAHQLEKRYSKLGYQNIRVYGVVRASMSGRPYQNFWDPDIDLTKIKRSLWRDNFMLPLKYDRPTIPPLWDNLNGKLKTDYGYWRETYPANDLRLDDDFHQRYPHEIIEYQIKKRKEKSQQ